MFLCRYKSPTFRNSETQLLLQLIDKYKYPLLIKSTLFSVTHTKDKAWAELTKEFNTLNTEYNYERTTDVLKTKWDNLKRLARRSSKNAVEPSDIQFHNEIVRSVIKICETDVGPMVEPGFNSESVEPGKLILLSYHNVLLIYSAHTGLGIICNLLFFVFSRYLVHCPNFGPRPNSTTSNDEISGCM